MNCSTEIAHEHVQSLHELLQQVPDYRAKRGRRYEAATVLIILLLAKLAGESTLSGIAHWARLREAWLKEVFGRRRLPCANTYAYVCTRLDMAELNAKVRAWLMQVTPERQADELLQWAIDGKVLRGSLRKGFQRHVPPPATLQARFYVPHLEADIDLSAGRRHWRIVVCSAIGPAHARRV